MQNSENLETTFNLFYSQTKRPVSEQLIGFFLFLSTTLTLTFVNNWISRSFQVPIGLITTSLQNLIWTISSFFEAISFWILWKSLSFKDLKLEASFLSFNLLLTTVWHILFFALHQPFLGLIINLILLGSTILCCYTFWRKDKLSGLIFSFYLFWICTVTAFNMVTCI